MINKFEAFYLLRLLDFSKNFRLDLRWMRQSKSNSKLISRNVGQRISQIRSFSFYFFRFSKNFWIRWFISVSVVRWQAVRCLVRSKVLVTLAVRVSDTGWLFFFFFLTNTSVTRDGCGYIQWFLTAVNWEKCVWFERVDRAGWTRFFFYEKSWKIISRTDSFGLLFIEITMLLNFQWKKIIKKKNWEINRAFHVLLYFVILPWKFYLYCVWTSTLYRKRVYITPEVVFFRYTNSVDGVAAIEFPDRYCQSETEEIARTIFEQAFMNDH